MNNLFEYLLWRGDLTMAQAPFNEVDNLILATLTYIHFRDLISADITGQVTISEACSAFLALPVETQKTRMRIRNDGILAQKLIESPRISKIPMIFHRDVFDTQSQIQFAAMAFLLEDGSAFVGFRGTDNSIVGWKEDFNMTFQEVVPAQLAALQYLEDFSKAFDGRIRVGGHSKGGNLAVYAAASVPSTVRDRIIEVYNNDGPGFFRDFLQREGYTEILPRIKGYTPQSSLVGLLLEHEEPHTIIRSHEIGPLQHDPYSWEVLGGVFIRVDDVTSSSRMVDRTLKLWLEELTNEDRENFVEAVYDIFTQNDLQELREFKNVKILYGVLKSLHREDDNTKSMMTKTMGALARSVGQAMRGVEDIVEDAEPVVKKKILPIFTNKSNE